MATVTYMTMIFQSIGDMWQSSRFNHISTVSLASVRCGSISQASPYAGETVAKHTETKNSPIAVGRALS